MGYLARLKPLSYQFIKLGVLSEGHSEYTCVTEVLKPIQINIVSYGPASIAVECKWEILLPLCSFFGPIRN